MLQTAGCGFGYLALQAICAEQAKAAEQSPVAAGSPSTSGGALAPRTPHHRPRAKRVIMLFMHGGVSHVDSFDYKPQLAKHDGKDIPLKLPNNLSKGIKKTVMGPQWKFKQRSESGLWISDLFPHIAQHADDLCVINSMHTKGQSHGQAVMMLHTGSDNLVRPSVGSWVNYGLGTPNSDLPGFVSLTPPRGHGGPRNYGAAFLPAAYQGTPIGHSGENASKAQIRYLTNDSVTPDAQRDQLDLLQAMNRDHLQRAGSAQGDPQIEGVIESYELAFRMQAEAPKVLDIDGETKATNDLYGIGVQPTDNFGRLCLMARRLSESGVRFVQVSTPYKWDQHGGLKKGHERNAAEVDRPIAGLLTDLQSRGMLDDTLVIFATEFGRTPVIEGSTGRDHNPQGFSIWLAGAGTKGGFQYGATDEFGYYAVQNKVHMHDLHATVLHMLGLDHERLTYRYAGRDFRLTDVYGRVVSELYA